MEKEFTKTNWASKLGKYIVDNQAYPGSGGEPLIEVDPTVPSWAKSPQKPAYLPEEIGAASKQDLESVVDSMSDKEDVSNKNINGGYAGLNESGKILMSLLPDSILGQMVHAGDVNISTMVANLTTFGKEILGTNLDVIILTDDETDVTGYKDNQGNYYLVTNPGTFSGLDFGVGDWLIANSFEWGKVDNTDEVTGVKGNEETTYRIGNINLTPENIGALSVGSQAADSAKLEGKTTSEILKSITGINVPHEIMIISDGFTTTIEGDTGIDISSSAGQVQLTAQQDEVAISSPIGNVNLSSGEDISIDAGGTININSQKSLNIEGGTDALIGANNNLTIQNVSDGYDIYLKSKGMISMNSNDNITIESLKNIDVTTGNNNDLTISTSQISVGGALQVRDNIFGDGEIYGNSIYDENTRVFSKSNLQQPNLSVKDGRSETFQVDYVDITFSQSYQLSDTPLMLRVGSMSAIPSIDSEGSKYFEISIKLNNIEYSRHRSSNDVSNKGSAITLCWLNLQPFDSVVLDVKYIYEGNVPPTDGVCDVYVDFFQIKEG